MSRKEWHKILIEHKQHRPMSLSVSLISICYGLFIIYYHGYFLGILHPSIVGIEPIYLGLPLIILGVMKILGMVLENDVMRRIAVIGLAFVWGGLLVINFVYAIGDGYPNPMWLFMSRVVYDCAILAVKGSYD